MVIAIIDYGMGNLRSVSNAFTALGQTACVTAEPAELRGADAIVLPGVGAFGDGIRNLRERGWLPVLEDEVRRKGKPFLGICLGMELLATHGTEDGLHEGLNWIPGIVDRLPSPGPGIRVPHIGWNDVRFVNKDGLYAGLGDSQTFYFVHGYVLAPGDERAVSGICSYGVDFAASVEVGNISATQFHPEKSQRAGFAVLSNFVRKSG